MSKTMKNTPKLRFPEFRDAPEWEEKTLENVCEKISDGIHSTPIYDDNGEFYFINGNNLTNSKIEINENTKKINETEYLKYKVELSSQTILLSINGTIGNLAFFNNEKIILGKSASYLNLKLNENKYFIFNLLQSSNTRKHFEKELTGSTIKNLSLTTIKNTKVIFPHPKEQQKIADCLSSVDELITAQSAKVEALKAHKKALMQQLFPAEGETTPRLRFPEFKNAPAWEEKQLVSYEDLVHGDGDWILSKDITDNGEFKIIQLANIGFGQYIDKSLKTISMDTFKNLKCKSIEKGDLLINRMVDESLNSCIFNFSGNYITSVDVCWIRQNEYINNYFFMNLLSTTFSQKKLLSLASGGGRVRISKKNLFQSFEFLLPSKEEQQKIADCLCSVDELITAQSAKVEALKTHKKALMQQLFPTSKEI